MKTRLAAGLLLLTVAVTAHGQEVYPPCTKTPTNADIDAAKALHTAATRYNKLKRYGDAIRNWKDAYNFDCTAHLLLINIGNAYEKLNVPRSALLAFKTYLARAGADADKSIAKRVSDLEKTLAGPHAGGGGQGASTGGAGGQGGQGGQGGEIKLPDPVDPPDGGAPVAPWVLVGVGAAAGITGGVLLGLGAGELADVREKCPGGVCPRENFPNDAEWKQASEDGDKGPQTMMALGGVVLGVGVAAIGGGLIWYFVGGNSDDSTSTNDKPAASSGMWVTPLIDPATGGLMLGGRF